MSETYHKEVDQELGATLLEFLVDHWNKDEKDAMRSYVISRHPGIDIHDLKITVDDLYPCYGHFQNDKICSECDLKKVCNQAAIYVLVPYALDILAKCSTDDRRIYATKIYEMYKDILKPLYNRVASIAKQEPQQSKGVRSISKHDKYIRAVDLINEYKSFSKVLPILKQEFPEFKDEKAVRKYIITNVFWKLRKKGYTINVEGRGADGIIIEAATKKETK